MSKYDEFEKSISSLGRNLTRAKYGYVSEITQAAFVGWRAAIEAVAKSLEVEYGSEFAAEFVRRKFGVE